MVELKLRIDKASMKQGSIMLTTQDDSIMIISRYDSVWRHLWLTRLEFKVHVYGSRDLEINFAVSVPGLSTRLAWWSTMSWAYFKIRPFERGPNIRIHQYAPRKRV